MDPADLRTRLGFDDGLLLAECHVDEIAAVGPGGQKRNRTRSAVRLRHRPSGLATVGRETRSKATNLARAVRRLREAIAVAARLPLPADPCWPPGVDAPGGCLRVAPKNSARPEALALLLDALAEHEGRAGAAAAALGVSTSSFVRALSGHGGAFAEANRIRAAHGQSALRQG